MDIDFLWTRVTELTLALQNAVFEKDSDSAIIEANYIRMYLDQIELEWQRRNAANQSHRP